MAKKKTTLLEDMRHVYHCDRTKDKTPGQVKCRDWYEKHPERFLRMYKDAEDKDEKEQQPEEKEAFDPKTVNVLAMIDRLLEELKT